MRDSPPSIPHRAMSASSSQVPAAGGAGFQSVEELQDFKSFVPDTQAFPSASPSRPSAARLKSFAPSTSEDAERVNAVIVIVLTLACTALSLFDLFLLASGS